LHERPNFFVYLPNVGADRAFFSLQDEDGNHVYQVTLEIPSGSSAQVLTIPLPDSAPALEPGINYLWYFAPLAPGSSLRPDTQGSVGWVRRILPEALPDGGNITGTRTTPIDLAAQYARQGIWYDTLMVLATAMQESPGDPALNQEWAALLSQVGLADLAQHPVATQSLR
jgi:hypothetical protein